eukprot:CAMPEP_0115173618 /NCGR_PEP_ID=MMETSP0270-20121206/3417_1 /TAXON_ID=71861 /ORGANISM="Scrippsiella trochoidea, Strain CCMP3099" /LENGTH=970 /DNA_ID=CAMNT_0002586433 /DNA_START=39 /DNA_END=2948 /DNA_ORIENTATION=-
MRSQASSMQSVPSLPSTDPRFRSFFGGQGVYQHRSDASTDDALWAELSGMAGRSDSAVATPNADNGDDEACTPVGTPSNSTRTTKTDGPTRQPGSGLDDILRNEFMDSEAEDEDTDGQALPAILPTEQKDTGHRGLSADVIDSAFTMAGQAVAPKLEPELHTDSRDPSPKPIPEGTEVDHSQRSCKASVARLIEKPIWQVWFMGLTFYSLFSPDVDLLVGTKESGFNLSIVTTVVFGMFGIELVMQSIAKTDYLCRAYFWLDLIALASLLPDTWLMKAMTSNNQFVAARSSKISRIIRVASRSSKATRLNRLTRIVRVASLIPRLAVACGYRKKHDEIKRLVDKKLQRLFRLMDDDADGFVTQEVLSNCIARFKSSSATAVGDDGVDTAQGVDVDRGASIITQVTSTNSTPVANRCASEKSTVTSINSGFNPLGDSFADLVSFEEFRRGLLEDEQVRAKLFFACREQLKRSNNMQRIASKHSEDLGVKVALGVLLLLLVQGLVEPEVTDHSDILGLQQLDLEAHSRFANFSGAVPAILQRHVELWSQGPRKVLYLDLRHHEYCNEFATSGNSCQAAEAAAALNWRLRKPMAELDEELMSSSYRLGDLTMLRLPTWVEDASDDLDDAELNSTVTSLAILSIRDSVETEARISLITTGTVIVIILSGIMLLTKDMTYMSRRLLRPLRNLADEMRNIVRLQLAGLEDDFEDDDGRGEGAQQTSIAEIQLIQSIFDKMKKAIKSWGKYVPWPVVQILLKAGEDANPGVREQEVTIFFSDIASFTTIVETLPPEQSLLLLSRYFHDMSKIIDDHQGIVIEFIGDAILSVYGAPMPNEDHASSAVTATVKMLRELDKLNRWAAPKGLPEVKIRCGVHSGNVLIGNMGFHSRMKYGVVGENASIPSRLEEMNKDYGTDMLISQSTLSKLKKGAFVVRPIDVVHLRSAPGNKAEVVYQVLAPSGKSNSSKGGRLKPVA